MDQEPGNGLISRRTLLGGTAALSLATAFGLDTFTAPAAYANPPTSVDGVISLGRSYLNLTLAEMKPLTSAPWNSYNGNWCAWYLSWITRGLGYASPTGYTADADYWDFLPSPPSNQAQVGDFARIYNGGGSLDYHIGLVTGVSGGAVTTILDGNRSLTLPHTATTVREAGVYSPVSLRRPFYPGGSSGGDMPTAFTTSQTTATPLTQMSWVDVEQFAGSQWPKLAYQGAATNLAELVPSASLFDVAISLYVSNLPAGHHVGVRLGVWNKTTNAVSGLASMTFEGDSAGRARGNYSMRAQIVQSQSRLCVQAYSTAPAAVLNWWGCDGLAW